MREIKFRAWDKKEKKMHQSAGITPHGDYCFDVKKGSGSQWFQFDDEHIRKFGIYYPDDVILMQFTGLKDKNGKEIYEGDIVKLVKNLREQGEKSIFEVKFDGVLLSPFLTLKGEDVTVIGNIYENPSSLA